MKYRVATESSTVHGRPPDFCPNTTKANIVVITTIAAANDFVLLLSCFDI
jgi:hypothetical protein